LMIFGEGIAVTKIVQDEKLYEKTQYPEVVTTVIPAAVEHWGTQSGDLVGLRRTAR
jgi:hypothetical protein